MPRRYTYYSHLFAFIILLLLSKDIWGQYRFTNFNGTHGLPLTSIQAFAEDSLGYLWLGSSNGLARFDGLEFKYYEPRGDDSTTILGSEIADIQVERNGRIWVTFHDGGLSTFDHNSQQFISKRHTKDDGEDFPQFAILNFLIDNEEQKIWAASGREGLYEIDMKTLKGKKIISLHRNYSVVQDPRDPDYLYMGGSKLIRVNKKTHEAQPVADQSFNRMMLNGNKIYGHDWSSSIAIYDIETKSLDIIPCLNTHINRGIIHNDENIWLVNYGGIYSFNEHDQTVVSLNFDPTAPFAIGSNHITGIYKDSKERIWLGTDEGLGVIIPEYQKLVDVKSAGNTRFSSVISGFEKNKYFAVSLYGSDISEIDLKADINTPIPYSGKEKIISPNDLVKTDGKIWLLCHNLLGYITPSEKTVKKYDGGGFNDLIHKPAIGDLIKDNNENLWISKHHDNLLIKISTSDNKIDTFRFQELGPEDELKVTYFDGKAIWLGTDIGLCRFDLVSKKKSWFYNSNPTYAAFHSSIEDLASDSEGNLWVLALEGGTWKCKYHEEQDSLEVIRGYFQSDGLANNRPWDIKMDQNGTLYFGSTSGMSMYSPDNDRMVSYEKAYGFQLMSLSTEVINDKVFILSRGLAYFNVDDLKADASLPTVLIKSVKVNGNEFQLKESRKFTHNENDIRIDFASIQLSGAREISYKYRLQDDNNWTTVGYNNNMANFNELIPGSYNFEISATGKNMNWGPVTSFQFQIAPPYWQTWWFRTISILLIGLLIYGFIKWRESQIRLIGNMQTRMTELENEALRAQMNPHFIFNSLNSIKSYIINNKKEEAADYLTTFAELIRTILRNSQTKHIPLSEEIKALDLYMEIENIRLNDKFNVEWKIQNDIDTRSIMVPPLTFQPFVENAIWHGFIHKKDKGVLTISIGKEKEHLAVSIKDNGIGRERSKEIEKKHFRKRSFGIAITEQRLGYKDKLKNNIEIIDIVDNNGNSRGTEVLLHIPYSIIDDNNKSNI